MKGFMKRASVGILAVSVVLPAVLLAALSVQLLQMQRAHAVPPCPPPGLPGGTLNRCEEEGYFTGLPMQYTGPGDPAPPMWDIAFGGCLWNGAFVCGIWQNTDYIGVTDAAGFIGTTWANLNLNFDACRGTSLLANYWSTNGVDWDDPANVCWKNKARATHAAFLVSSMAGRWGTDFGSTPDSNHAGVQWALANFGAWTNMVNGYVASGSVDFNAVVAPQCINGTHTQTFNVARYGQDIVHVFSPGCAPLAPTILFSTPTGTYEINKTCANVKGPLTPLAGGFVVTPFVQPPTLTPDDNPTSADFQSSFTINRRAGPISITGQFFLKRNGVSLAPFDGFATSGTYDPADPPGSHSFSYPNRPIPGLLLGDEVCQRLTVGPSFGQSDPGGGIVAVFIGSATAEDCTAFQHKPYSKVFGGDVMAGAGFGTGCSVDGEAGLIGFNKLSGADYIGSGTQLAAFALGQILGYSSAQTAAPANPKQLTFANTGGGYASTLYGGDLDNGSAACAPDYYATRTTGTTLNANWNMPASANGIYSRTGDLSLSSSASGLQNNNRVTVFVRGNVFINDNIGYDNTTYANMSQIPSFRLIVQGNIYVAPGVSTLNGLYVAQPDPANPVAYPGRFYTCGSQAWAGNPQPFVPTATQIVAQAGGCRQSLTVFGAVVADSIKLLRTAGTLSNSNAGERYDTGYGADQGPAERFVFSPEMWLAGDIFSGAGSYDSINVLPPIL